MSKRGRKEKKKRKRKKEDLLVNSKILAIVNEMIDDLLHHVRVLERERENIH